MGRNKGPRYHIQIDTQQKRRWYFGRSTSICETGITRDDVWIIDAVTDRVSPVYDLCNNFVLFRTEYIQSFNPLNNKMYRFKVSILSEFLSRFEPEKEGL